MKKIIVQPATTERVLSSAAFMPYWIYAAFKESFEDAEIWEDVTIRQWDELLYRKDRDDCLFLIDLSTFPQIDFALQAHQELIREGCSFSFIGLKPLIDMCRLPYYDVPQHFILSGVFHYLAYLDEFEFGLRIDNDHHLVSAARSRRVVPMFLSVGCKRACPYCYISTSNYPRGEQSWDRVKYLLDMAREHRWDLHFTDENFFYNSHAERIVEYLQGMDLRWICLTDTLALTEMIRTHGEAWLHDSGNVCNEVGLETVDPTALGKRQDVERLLDSAVPIYWLTMTFLPYDTLRGMNATGRFLKQHGYRPEELIYGMVVNSTRGGLGQFMQLYPGTEYWGKRSELGVMYSQRSTRLWPSFIGHRLLNSKPKKIRAVEDEDLPWFELYVGRKKVLETLDDVGGLTFEEIIELDDMQAAVALAQLARLEIITEDD